MAFGGTGRAHAERPVANWDAECGIVLLCAFGGIRLQNGADFLLSGMSGLEKCLGGRA